MSGTYKSSGSVESPLSPTAIASYPNRDAKAPVFVLGCPRSGTTVLYHMLLSAGGFAVYRAESNVFNLLIPRFGDLSSAANRRQLLAHWLRSKLFHVTGLTREEIEGRVMDECRSGGDFLRITMEATARKQGVERWADCTPDHLLNIPEIQKQLPGSYVIHIIRDGRDVALSYVQQRWSHPLPWDKNERLAVAGLYWEWVVRKGREYGRMLGPNYCEVHFEDLIAKPREVLATLSEFVGQELDYDRIQQTAIGSVSEPNSSFLGDSGKQGFQPVGRWKSKMTAEEVQRFEELVGDFLQTLGYPVSDGFRKTRSLRALRLRGTYLPMFTAKQWLKSNTPLGRRVNIGPMEIAG